MLYLHKLCHLPDKFRFNQDDSPYHSPSLLVTLRSSRLRPICCYISYYNIYIYLTHVTLEPGRLHQISQQMGNQDPKLEVPTIYFRPIFEAYVHGNIPITYGLKYGTNVPPF